MQTRCVRFPRSIPGNVITSQPPSALAAVNRNRVVRGETEEHNQFELQVAMDGTENEADLQRFRVSLS